MRVCVFGAGSLGSAIGGLLSRENEVTLIGRRAHVREVLARGLRLTGDVRMTARVSASESVASLDPPGLLIITTKAYDTEEAIAECRDWVSEDSLVLTLQNGLGNLEALRKWRGDKALGGTTTLGATLASPGIVRVSGFGKTIVGSDLNASAAREVARSFSESGIPTSTVKDVYREIWSKAIVSACINPTTAVLRIPNGAILESPAVRGFLDALCTECVSVARSSNVALESRKLQERVHFVARNTRRNTSSMLLDVQLGRKTEIAQINGAFCRIGERNGIPSPLNRVLTSLVESLEAQTRKQKG